MLQTLILFAVLAASPGLVAQAPQQEEADPRPRVRAGLTPAEVVHMLDAYAIVQAQEVLRLSESQYPQFVTRLKKLHQTRRQAQQERNRLLQQLQRLAGPQATQVDENAIRTHLKTLRELDERSALEVRKAHDAVDEVLDVRQQARFRMFEERLERRKLDLLMRARQGAAATRR